MSDLNYPPAAAHPDDVAVIIGNADYSGSTDIPSVLPALHDADAMRRYAAQALGIREGNIIFVKDATGTRLTEIFGNDRDYKGRLYDYVKPGKSRVFVYYAGHGAPVGKGTAVLVPVDASPQALAISGYPLSQLYANLGKLPARSVTVVLEACFSGASQTGSVVPSASPVLIQAKTPMVPPGVTVIAAGAADQIASWDPSKEHGLFTEEFLLGMSGEADKPPYGNGDGKVTLDELDRFLKENVTYLARRYWGRDQDVQIIQGGGQ